VVIKKRHTRPTKSNYTTSSTTCYHYQLLHHQASQTDITKSTKQHTGSTHTHITEHHRTSTAMSWKGFSRGVVRVRFPPPIPLQTPLPPQVSKITANMTPLNIGTPINKTQIQHGITKPSHRRHRRCQASQATNRRLTKIIGGQHKRYCLSRCGETISGA
jgi:hypothetical protein